MKITKTLIIGLLIISPLSLFAQRPDFKFVGLKMNVTDLGKAYAFYAETLGFKVEKDRDRLFIADQSINLVIEETTEGNQNEYPFRVRTGVSLLVNKLLPAIDQFRDRHVYLYDTLLARNGVGISIPLRDPFGNVINLIEVQVFDRGPVHEPTIYNAGVTISDMDKAIAFYEGVLGFEEWSRNYLPAALPLKHADGSFAFMIHYQKDIKTTNQSYLLSPGMSLQFEVENLDGARAYLEQAGINVLGNHEKLFCQDPEGNWLEIVGSAF